METKVDQGSRPDGGPLKSTKKTLSQRTVTMRKGSQRPSTVQRRSRKGLQPRRPQVKERVFISLIATKEMEWAMPPPP